MVEVYLKKIYIFGALLKNVKIRSFLSCKQYIQKIPKDPNPSLDSKQYTFFATFGHK